MIIKTHPAAIAARDQDFSRLPKAVEILDAALARADQEGLSHLNFLELILGEPAARSRQRAIERRIRLVTSCALTPGPA